MTFSQYVHSMYDAKIEAVSFTQLQMQNRTDSTMQKQALCSRRYLVRTAAGACTLMYRYELQRSESVPVLHC